MCDRKLLGSPCCRISAANPFCDPCRKLSIIASTPSRQGDVGWSSCKTAEASGVGACLAAALRSCFDSCHPHLPYLVLLPRDLDLEFFTAHAPVPSILSSFRDSTLAGRQTLNSGTDARWSKQKAAADGGRPRVPRLPYPWTRPIHLLQASNAGNALRLLL
jgi:hypothetical protein